MVWSMSLEFHRLDDDIFYCDGMNCYTMEDSAYPLKVNRTHSPTRVGSLFLKFTKSFKNWWKDGYTNLVKGGIIKK